MSSAIEHDGCNSSLACETWVRVHTPLLCTPSSKEAALKHSNIDRLSRNLVQVRPDLASVSTTEELREWAEAVVTWAGAVRQVNRGTGAAAGDDCHGQHREAAGASGAFGLRYWEQALAAVLERMRLAGELKPEVDTAALGAAFAALVYGGLLLDHTSGDASALRAALDMALGQVARVAEGGGVQGGPGQPGDVCDKEG